MDGKDTASGAMRFASIAPYKCVVRGDFMRLRRGVLNVGFRPAYGKGELSRQFPFHPQCAPALRRSALPSVGREPGSRSTSSALAKGKGKPSAMVAMARVL
ncbi:hypothetical protein SAMN05660284_00853 [Formivibrio citricus]|uniref:Uncharacterized protein n=1 Tax=Formivibrio citricus TaxID=83765 RepID=A0A1I4X234_9NEIS|nr:hypothetical protein SAMN05660284_00853 [Formivibrio citricus]